MKTKLETLDKAMDICTGYLPFMSECKDKRQMVLFTLMGNIEYCEALIKYHEEHGRNDLMPHKATISHDILGLYDEDEHFVPRIS